MDIRATTLADIDAVLDVHARAFGDEKGPEIAELVAALFDDATANPMVSFAACEDGRIVGHILFSHARIEQDGLSDPASLLAPLAVIPEVQSRGVGGQLVRHGLKHLADSGVDIVFVLGHPEYYPRFGFSPAGARGFKAPYPIPDEHANAWMVNVLIEGEAGHAGGRVVCADALDKPEYWRE